MEADNQLFETQKKSTLIIENIGPSRPQRRNRAPVVAGTPWKTTLRKAIVDGSRIGWMTSIVSGVDTLAKSGASPLECGVSLLSKKLAP